MRYSCSNFRHYVAEVRRQKTQIDECQLVIGKLACEVQERFGMERLRELAVKTRVDYNTMLRYQSVYKHFRGTEFEEPHPALTWTQYRSAAPQADRVELLAQAVEESWSTQDLKDHLRERRAKRERQLPIPDAVYQEVGSQAAAQVMADPALKLSPLEQTILDFIATVGSATRVAEGIDQIHGRRGVMWHVDSLTRCIDGLVNLKEGLQGYLARREVYHVEET